MSFHKVAKRVKNNKKERILRHVTQAAKDRELRLAPITKLMEEADAAEESSVDVPVEWITHEEDIGYMRMDVLVTEKRSADGRLVAYKINW